MVLMVAVTLGHGPKEMAAGGSAHQMCALSSAHLELGTNTNFLHTIYAGVFLSYSTQKFPQVLHGLASVNQFKTPAADTKSWRLHVDSL